LASRWRTSRFAHDAENVFGRAAQRLIRAATWVCAAVGLQNTQFRLAEMATNLAAARLMVRQAANLLDAGSPHATAYAAMAKLFATDNGFNVRAANMPGPRSLWDCSHRARSALVLGGSLLRSATRRCSCTAAMAT